MKNIDMPPQCKELHQLISQYRNRLSHKFQQREKVLLQQLENHAKMLKQEIAFYAKEVSQQNLDMLIAKKKTEKESERLKLQIQWRELTQRLKKLEEEERKIDGLNRQAQHDVQALKMKIRQLKSANKKLEKNIEELNDRKENFPFITQTKQQYKSPYKYQPIVSLKQKTKNIQIQAKIQQKLFESQITKLKNSSANSYERLIQFLGNQNVRDKIFDILKQ